MNDDVGEPQFQRPEDNIKVYLSLAKLPEMTLNETAPPLIPPGHKAHLNHLHVQPERYRRRLCNLISCKDPQGHDQLVKRFVQRLPTAPIDVPSADERTGAAFTIPVLGLDLNVPTPFLPHPSTIHEIVTWMYAYPFQTLTRTMQVSFPRAAASWDLAPLPTGDIDVLIWQTFVWRKSPPASKLESFYRKVRKSTLESSLIICIQPEWVLTDADIASFKRVDSFPVYSDRDNNPAYKSPHRIWAKLWDLCVRAKCRFWVLTSYQRWIFGSFSKGFQAGHIFTIKSFDASNPTVMEVLVFHVAKSMGLANDLYLPEYFDSTEDNDDPPEPPHPPTYPEMEFPDSDSEWEDMDDANVDLEPFPSTAPGTSAGVSDYLDARLSAYGSEANVELPIVRIFRTTNGDIHNRPIPSRTPLPVAGPSRSRVKGTRRTRGSSYVAGSTYPTDSETEIDNNLGTARAAARGVRLNHGLREDDSDVESDRVQTDPPPGPARRQYLGVSRATAETTDNIVVWSDNIEIDANAVEDLLQMEGIEDENPNAITHALSTETLYLAALQTLDQNGGPSHSLPRPPPQTVHSRPLRNIGGYLTVVPELGTIREAEEAVELREEARREALREAAWMQSQREGVVVAGDAAEHHPDDNNWIAETHYVLDHPPPATM